MTKNVIFSYIRLLWNMWLTLYLARLIIKWYLSTKKNPPKPKYKIKQMNLIKTSFYIRSHTFYKYDKISKHRNICNFLNHMCNSSHLFSMFSGISVTIKIIQNTQIPPPIPASRWISLKGVVFYLNSNIFFVFLADFYWILF